MIRNLCIAILCAVAITFFIPKVFAQDDAPPPPSSSAEVPDEKKANPGSQEVEYSEDNYRRFMELKDKNLQKSSLPTNKYQSGTQKLDELPESSQKHLRNQLREVIVQEGAWTPGDENKDYPYVPSEAAEGNAGLKQQEAEAWQELVGEYHEREAQIHANAVRSDAAGAAAQAGDMTGGSAAQAGSGGPGGHEGANMGNQGAGKQGMQTGQQQRAQDRNEGGYSPGSAAQQSDPNVPSTAGVSENAMEFLMKNGGLETKKKAGANAGSSGSEVQGEKTAQAGQENTIGQTTAADSNAMMTSASEAAQKETNSQSTAGSSQNAMEFLVKKGDTETGNGASTGGTAADNKAQGEQTAQTAQENSTGQPAAADPKATNTPASQAVQKETNSRSTAGSSQNAMEYLTGSENQDSSDTTTEASPMDPDSEFEVVSKGTLSIKDLSNAKGVTRPGDSLSTPADEDKEKDKKDDGPQ